VRRNTRTNNIILKKYFLLVPISDNRFSLTCTVPHIQNDFFGIFISLGAYLKFCFALHVHVFTCNFKYINVLTNVLYKATVKLTFWCSISMIRLLRLGTHVGILVRRQHLALSQITGYVCVMCRNWKWNSLLTHEQYISCPSYISTNSH